MGDVFTKELFDQIQKSGYNGTHLLHLIANRRDEFSPVIAQLNRMADKLPENAKSNRGFLDLLTSPREDDFAGAFNEMVTNFVLQHIGCSVIYEPVINKQTPDFYATIKNRTLIVEAATISQPENEARMDELIHLLHQELKGLDSTIRISIRGMPVADKNGRLTGLKQEIEKFLTTYDPSNDADHNVRTENGASISFTAYDLGIVGNVLGGWSSLHSGDPYSGKISDVLWKKSKKYRFPFTLSLVSDFRARLDLHSLEKAVIGNPAIIVTVGADELEPTSTNTFDGFWGTKHKYFEKNHVIQNILLTRLGWGEDRLLNLYSVQFQNPYFRHGWEEVFPMLPDVSLHEGNPDDVKSLKIVP